jgi:hypothetical protein
MKLEEIGFLAKFVGSNPQIKYNGGNSMYSFLIFLFLLKLLWIEK